MVKIFDVSLPVKEGMIVYPKNPEPSIIPYAHIPMQTVNESRICLGSHTGTHVDSQKHIRNDGPAADTLPLDTLYGDCRVLDMTAVDREIHRQDLEKHGIKQGEIILLRTKNSLAGYQRFRKDFVHIKMDAAEHLIQQGVKTLGFDYLSVKKFGGDQEVHELLISHLTLFEGLDLSAVTEGEYTFAGLPLRIACDGAPARVILIKS